MTAAVRLIPELPGAGRLGRHVEHDEASRAFQAARAPHLVSVLHHRRAKPFDQGELGACTGNAMAGLLDTAPFTHSHLSERTAVKLYELATTLDDIDEAYPPTDTGSSGLAVAKAAKQLGYITSYAHAFGLAHALDALVIAPVITGIPWFDSFDAPDVTDGGLITITPNAGIRGGHEVEVLGLDVVKQRVRIPNSWGVEWGDHGYCELSWDDWGQCLANDGDVTTVGIDI